MKVIINDGEPVDVFSVRVLVEDVATVDDDGEEVSAELHFVFTGEGLVQDLVIADEIAGTSSETYDDIAEGL